MIFGYDLRWVYKMSVEINFHRFYFMFASIANKLISATDMVVE